MTTRQRSRRFAHQGVYFPDMSGLHAALIDAGQLTLCLEALLSECGLLDAVVVACREMRASHHPPIPAITAREALEALLSVYRVFSNAASVVRRVDQAIEQCGVMFDAAQAGDDVRVQDAWATAFTVCANVAADRCPVPRSVTKAARATLRRHEQREKYKQDGKQNGKQVRGSGGANSNT